MGINAGSGSKYQITDHAKIGASQAGAAASAGGSASRGGVGYALGKQRLKYAAYEGMANRANARGLQTQRLGAERNRLGAEIQSRRDLQSSAIAARANLQDDQQAYGTETLESEQDFSNEQRAFGETHDRNQQAASDQAALDRQAAGDVADSERNDATIKGFGDRQSSGHKHEGDRFQAARRLMERDRRHAEVRASIPRNSDNQMMITNEEQYKTLEDGDIYIDRGGTTKRVNKKTPMDADEEHTYDV